MDDDDVDDSRRGGTKNQKEYVKETSPVRYIKVDQEQVAIWRNTKEVTRLNV
jgi:hypothetical protein